MRILLLICIAVALAQATPQGRARARGLRRFSPRGRGAAEETAAVEEEQSPAENEAPQPQTSSRRRPQAVRPTRFRGRTNRNEQPVEVDMEVAKPVKPKKSNSRRRLRIPQTLKPTKPAPPKVEETPVMKEEMPEMELVEAEKEMIKEEMVIKEMMQEKNIPEEPMEIETPKPVIKLPSKPVIKPLSIRIAPRRRSKPAPEKASKPIDEPKEMEEASSTAGSSRGHRFSSLPRIRGRGRGRSPAKETPVEEQKVMEEQVVARPSRRRLLPTSRSEPKVAVEVVEEAAEPAADVRSSSSPLDLEIVPTTEQISTTEKSTQPPTTGVPTTEAPTTKSHVIEDFVGSFFDDAVPTEASSQSKLPTTPEEIEYEYIIYEYYDDEEIHPLEVSPTQKEQPEVAPTAKTTTTTTTTSTTTTTTTTRPPTTTTLATTTTTTDAPSTTTAAPTRTRIRLSQNSSRRRNFGGSTSGSPKWELVGTVEDTPLEEKHQILSGLGSRRRGLSRPSDVRKPKKPVKQEPIDDPDLYYDLYDY